MKYYLYIFQPYNDDVGWTISYLECHRRRSHRLHPFPFRFHFPFRDIEENGLLCSLLGAGSRSTCKLSMT